MPKCDGCGVEMVRTPEARGFVWMCPVCLNEERDTSSPEDTDEFDGPDELDYDDEDEAEADEPLDPDDFERPRASRGYVDLDSWSDPD